MFSCCVFSRVCLFLVFLYVLGAPTFVAWRGFVTKKVYSEMDNENYKIHAENKLKYITRSKIVKTYVTFLFIFYT